MSQQKDETIRELREHVRMLREQIQYVIGEVGLPQEVIVALVEVINKTQPKIEFHE